MKKNQELNEIHKEKMIKVKAIRTKLMKKKKN